MSDPKCAEMLFRAAERGLLTLRGMAAGVPDESFGFRIQQAAEKAFKAWLCLLGETYPLPIISRRSWASSPRRVSRPRRFGH